MGKVWRNGIGMTFLHTQRAQWQLWHIIPRISCLRKLQLQLHAAFGSASLYTGTLDMRTFCKSDPCAHVLKVHARFEPLVALNRIKSAARLCVLQSVRLADADWLSNQGVVHWRIQVSTGKHLDQGAHRQHRTFEL
jgi:hypothetical protein